MEDPFVSQAWLAEHLNEPSLRIVDTRSSPHGAPGLAAPSGAEQYGRGHIPGAVHLDYAEHLADPATPYAARVAPPELFAHVVGRAGIGDDTFVVAYDNGDVPYAARFFWMCRFYGHDAVRILAGGFKEWGSRGGPVTESIPSYAFASFTPRERPELRASCKEVLAVAEGRSDVQLLETQRDATYALRERDIAGVQRLSGNLLLEDQRGGRIASRSAPSARAAAASRLQARTSR
jgi:thiosulfate/3-mercaptopyruvate sulfurtransferase